jgi:hypothetical protein
MVQDMQFSFTSVSVEILLHILGYSFCIGHHILAHFCQMMSSLNALKIICAKTARFGTRNVDEM